jgi:hypothetical protein
LIADICRGNATVNPYIVHLSSDQVYSGPGPHNEPNVNPINIYAPTKLLAATNIHDIINAIQSNRDIELLVIDSIQTMFVPEFSSSPGTVSQVRAAASEIINLAKINFLIEFA